MNKMPLDKIPLAFYHVMLSVYLSVTLLYCIQMANDAVKLHPCLDIIIVLDF